MRRGSRDTRGESLLPDVSGPSASGGSMGVLDVARSLSASLQVRTQPGTARVASQGCWTLTPASRDVADPCWLEGRRPACWCTAHMASKMLLKGRPDCCVVLLKGRPYCHGVATPQGTRYDAQAPLLW